MAKKTARPSRTTKPPRKASARTTVKAKAVATTPDPTQGCPADKHVGSGDAFEELSALLRFRVAAHLRAARGDDDKAVPVFTTEASPQRLWDIYLQNMPTAERQHHTCHTCRQFIETYGGLVVIKHTGHATPILWASAADEPRLSILALHTYRRSLMRLYDYVADARVTGVFLSPLAIWGVPRTGPWTHFWIQPTGIYRANRESAYTPAQQMAEKTQDFQQVRAALADWPLPRLETAWSIIQQGDLQHDDAVKGPARWLHQLARRVAARISRADRDRLIWRAVATAPSGFCHPRTSLLGTVMADLDRGAPLETLRARYAAKTRPDRYQRPQAAPTEGTIWQAEALFEKLQLARALPRRIAFLDEVETFWTPAPLSGKPLSAPAIAAEPTGVFSALRQRPRPSTPTTTALPAVSMSWHRFETQVCPQLLRLDLYVPDHGAFGSLTTAVHPDAPPLLYWDHEVRRNPAAWYVYLHGASATQFYLCGYRYTPVVALTRQPNLWGTEPGQREAHPIQAGIFMLLSGARDKFASQHGSALFPVCLRSDLHSVRAVIEAHSNRTPLAVPPDNRRPQAAGLRIANTGGGTFTPIKVRAFFVGPCSQDITIDRWL